VGLIRSVSAVTRLAITAVLAWVFVLTSNLTGLADETVNTRYLAYAGASLPLMLLLSEAGQPLTSVATRKVVAVEIVRALVGSNE
jgi:uncharacterized membrane protein